MIAQGLKAGGRGTRRDTTAARAGIQVGTSSAFRRFRGAAPRLEGYNREKTGRSRHETQPGSQNPDNSVPGVSGSITKTQNSSQSWEFTDQCMTGSGRLGDNHAVPERIPPRIAGRSWLEHMDRYLGCRVPFGANLRRSQPVNKYVRTRSIIDLPERELEFQKQGPTSWPHEQRTKKTRRLFEPRFEADYHPRAWRAAATVGDLG